MKRIKHFTTVFICFVLLVLSVTPVVAYNGNGDNGIYGNGLNGDNQM
jgi:hypothetical protein